MEARMKILGTTAAMVLGGAVLVGAGEPATLGVGSRVRLQAEGGLRLKGLVVATDAETLTLSLEGGATRDVAWSSVRKIDVSRGRRSAGGGFLRGAGIGLAAGATVGALAGALSGDDPPCQDCWFRFSAGEKAAIDGVLLGGVGTILGGVTGAVAPGERWERAGEPKVRLTAQTDPSGRGAGLALRLAF
jgi:hypothetical protein